MLSDLKGESLPFYHGTRAHLEVGNFLRPGCPSNFREEPLSWIYFTQTLEAATWGAELAIGDGAQRIYVVEPTGPFENDPNLTDKKFPRKSHTFVSSARALRIIGEVTDWVPHTPEQLQQMRDGLAKLKAEGKDVIID